MAHYRFHMTWCWFTLTMNETVSLSLKMWLKKIMKVVDEKIFAQLNLEPSLIRYPKHSSHHNRTSHPLIENQCFQRAEGHSASMAILMRIKIHLIKLFDIRHN